MISRLPMAALLILPWLLPSLRASDGRIAGRLADPQGKPVAGREAASGSRWKFDARGNHHRCRRPVCLLPASGGRL